MRFRFLIFLILSFSSSSYSQSTNCAANCTCAITGTIVDGQTNEPIEFASLQIKGTAKGTTTNAEGYFEFTGLCETEVDLLISHIGYKPITHHHDIFHEEPIVKLAPDNLILESIVIEEESDVSAFKSNTAVKIEGRELEQIKSASLGNVLSSVAGVSTLSTGSNVTKPIIHGLHSNRILIINNGLRHESQDWGQEHAPEIDASLIDEIEVIKGAAAVKYGPNALGGVILVNPPEMELTSHLHGDVHLKGESNGRAIDGSILLQKGYGNFAWMAQGATRYQGDLEAPDYQLTNTGMREMSGAIGLRFHRKNWDMKSYFSFLHQELGILRGSITGNIEDLADAINDEVPDFTRGFSYDINSPKQVTEHAVFKTEAFYNFTNSQLGLTYGLQMNNRKEFDVRRGSNNETPSINLELTTHTLDVEWWHPIVNDWEGSIGMQWLYQDNNNIPGTNTIPFIPNYNNTRFGLFLTETRPLGNNYQFDIGIRYDIQLASFRGRDSSNDIFRNEQNFNSVSGIIGLSRTMSNGGIIRVNAATAWRPPNIAELYSFGKHQFTNEYGFYRYSLEGTTLSTDRVLDNNDLEVSNELGYKLIATYTYSNDRFQIEASPYLNMINNYIYKAPGGISGTVRGTLPLFIYKQTDAVFTGADVTIKYKHTDRLSSKVSGTFLYTKDIKNDDVLFNIPPNRLSYQLGYRTKIGEYEWSAAADVSYTFRQYNAPRVIAPEVFVENPDYNPFLDNNSNFDFTEAPDGYALLNLSSALSLRQWVFSVRVLNALNTSYRQYTNLIRYFADEQGINFEVGVQLKL
ncbi:TonB-dependent receptor [Fulvivirga lutea]|uniref:TonB-dependent receptor plug domain-containing protein n=1 Tax=Fulvivirga lutea TaxID=2810512 RepID=A0A975A146_9BACT|nr:TonB-dependent receptor [Fulvivirga lutea]QSE98049.1 TonB-dependent receptor plug domain-containing protein [Fulvivirga lutea]